MIFVKILKFTAFLYTREIVEEKTKTQIQKKNVNQYLVSAFDSITFLVIWIKNVKQQPNLAQNITVFRLKMQ